ncbi:KRTCAP2 [Acrasis kona]|uniref:KRTCAP2 n=1 Tax=Acrasis kona TaxID=1008807 RepID=A0AAW2YMI5_9EUKA
MVRPSTTIGTSLKVSILTVLALFSGLMTFKDTLADSDKGKILGGFLCSLIYLFTLTAIGNLYSSLSGASKATKWFEALIALLFAEFVASTIHGVCVTTCFLFSVIITYELYKLAAEGDVLQTSVLDSDRFITSKKQKLKK